MRVPLRIPFWVNDRCTRERHTVAAARAMFLPEH